MNDVTAHLALLSIGFVGGLMLTTFLLVYYFTKTGNRRRDDLYLLAVMIGWIMFAAWLIAKFY